MLYNLTKINATNPAVLVKSTSDVLLNGMMEEVGLVFLFIIILAAFIFFTRSVVQSLVRTSFAIVVLCLVFVWLEWVSGWIFFVCVAIYGISLLIAYLMPDY